MWVDLVRLREAGRKRPIEAVLRELPERGRLTLEPAAAHEAFRSAEAPEIDTSAFFRWKAVGGDFDNLQRLHDARVSIQQCPPGMVVSPLEDYKRDGMTNAKGIQPWAQRRRRHGRRPEEDRP
jgi:hypothetical protein